MDPENSTGPLLRAVGLVGEVGEVLNEVKKLEWGKLGLKGPRTTLDKLRAELADVIICADLLASEYGIDLIEAVRGKFNETSEKANIDVKL